MRYAIIGIALSIAPAAMAQNTSGVAGPVIDPDDPAHLRRSMRVEAIGLEVAADMVDLVDPSRGGDLLDRVRALRRKIALEIGLVLPAIRTRDPRPSVPTRFPAGALATSSSGTST